MIRVGKVCGGCKAFKDRSEFHLDNRRKDRMTHKCKKCVKEYHDQYYSKNKETVCLKQRHRYHHGNLREKVVKNPDEKRCTRCFRILLKKDFYAIGPMKKYLRSHCKECDKKLSRKS